MKIYLIIIITLLFIYKLDRREHKEKKIEDIQYLSWKPRSTLLTFSFLNNNRLLSDYYWTKFLQLSDHNHVKSHPFESWMFLTLKLVLDLDPYFYEAYRYGGIYLSVIKDNDLGAEFIFDKALKFYPHDFWINFHAGHHYYFELGKIDKTLQIYKKIQYNSDAQKYIPYLPSLVAKLELKKTNNLNHAFEMMLVAYQNAPQNPHIQEKFKHSLYSIKAQIDLECLNSIDQKNAKCSKTDYYGRLYLKGPRGHYFAREKWKPFIIGK